MTIKLAKKLKDAGFPQIWTDESQRRSYIANVDWVIPTLFELIEACGDDFYSIERQMDKEYKRTGKWNAIANVGEIAHKDYALDGTLKAYGQSVVCESGSTPEEAVAMLWLALNKK